MTVQPRSKRAIKSISIITLLLLASLFIWSKQGQSAQLAQTTAVSDTEQVAKPQISQSIGPGLSKITFPESDLFTVISRINTDNGAPKSHGFVSMHNGYLVIIYAIGGGRHQGGFAFYDISDPYNPQFVAGRDDEETFEIREAHNYGYSSSYTGEFEGRNLVAIQARRGVQIWDWTDITDPQRVSYLQMDGISGGDYTNANWWTFWQAPYIYIAGADSGIYIIDATDPRNPVLADRGDQPNPIPNSMTGGFRIGSLFAIGNLLVVAGNDVPGYATLDISDPINPTLLASTTSGPENYSVLVNGNRIYGAARFKELYSHDISDPTNIQQVGYFKGTNDKGGYLSYQDGFIHMGASVNYMKIDVQDDNNFFEINRASTGIADGDQDFVTVLGNMIVLGDDHDYGSFLIPHASEPDNLGPTVTMISPADGKLNQRTSSRVGLTFSDLIDLRSINAQSVQIRTVDGEALPGYYSGQSGVVNFTPAEPLEPDTVYQVFVPANGVKDVSGNGAPTDFRAYFSTGSALSAPPTCAIAPVAPIEVGSTSTFTATMLSGIGAVTYSWDFGDGTPPTEPDSAWTTSHTYQETGRYSIQVTIANDSGSGTCVTQATVHPPLSAQKATHSTTILIDRSGEKVWNVNPDNDTVTAINTLGYGKLIEVAVGDNPRTLAQAPDGTIWVANQSDATISILNSADGALMRTIELPYGAQPYGILFHKPSENLSEAVAYVSLQGAGKVIRIGLLSRTINGEVVAGPSPRGLALSGDGTRLFVGRFISPADRGEVIEINTTAFQVAGTFTLAADPGPDTESSGRGIPNGLGQMAISPDGEHLWVPAKKDNTLRGLLTDGQNHTFDSTVRTIVAQINLVTNSENPAERHDVENSDQASTVEFSQLGDYAFVALQGSNAVAVIDTESRLMVTRLHEVGRAPIGMALNADGARLFVHSFLSRSVLVYDVPALLAGDVNARQPLVEVSTVAQEKLALDVLEGKRIFYNAEDARMNKDGYISCATCHMDGDQDGRVWDRNGIGEGLRNTTSLLGHGGMAQGRVHWSGNFDEIQDFEHDMRTQFGGLGFLTDAQFQFGTRSQPLGDAKAGLNSELDALAAYLSSLTEVPDSPFRNPDGTLTADGVAGKAIFQQLSCGSCHGGSAFTDSPSGLLHDVGTIQSSSGKRLNQTLLGIDTPTLQSLWQSAPYLHNGSAPTLASLLTGTGLNAGVNVPHGGAGSLTTAELSQLVAYLLQLDGNEVGPTLPEPAILLAYPANEERFAPGESLLIQAAVTQALGPVAEVQFYVDGESIGRAAQPPYQIQWTLPTAVDGALYTIVAKVLYESSQGAAQEVRIGSDSAAVPRTPTASPGTPTAQATATPGGTAQTPTVTPTPQPLATSTPVGSGNGSTDSETIYLPITGGK